MRETVAGPAKRIPETDVGYAAARLRGMRAHLLDPICYDALIAAPDVQTAVRELVGTTYAPDLEKEMVGGCSAHAVDEALKDNMVRAYRKVLSFLDPGSRAMVTTLLGRWDIFNIKAVLRGAHNRVRYEEVEESLLPIGYLGSLELSGLAKLDEVKVIIDTLAMWGLPYAAPLRRAYPEYARSNRLAPLELALDRQYAQWASQRLCGEDSSSMCAQRVLGTQIDILNLITVLRAIKSEHDSEKVDEFFLDGGRSIRRDVFDKLTRLSDVDDLIDQLKGTPYGGAMEDAAAGYLERQSITVFERALEDLLVRRALGSGTKDPNGVGLAISYLWGKVNEVTSIRIIIKGKEVGMPADRVRRELILV